MLLLELKANNWFVGGPWKKQLFRKTTQNSTRNNGYWDYFRMFWQKFHRPGTRKKSHDVSLKINDVQWRYKNRNFETQRSFLERYWITVCFSPRLSFDLQDQDHAKLGLLKIWSCWRLFQFLNFLERFLTVISYCLK